MKEKMYIAADLKSFYASVECIERGLDPLTTNLVVADLSRTEKTICLAVTPSLKAWGISGRARLFEVVQKVKEVNTRRLRSAPGRQFTGSSSDDTALKTDPGLELDYIVAPPRMAHYIEWSTKIYNVYLKYVAPEDLFAYSIDEVLMDVTNYLPTYKLTPRELARKIGRFPAMIAVSFLCAAVLCNQAVTSMMGAQLLESAYDDREELAMDIENSGILIAGLIPWSIACSIPLAMLGAGNGAILYAFLLWLIPICYLGTKKKFYPQNVHPSSPPPSRGGKEQSIEQQDYITSPPIQQ